MHAIAWLLVSCSCSQWTARKKYSQVSPVGYYCVRNQCCWSSIPKIQTWAFATPVGETEKDYNMMARTLGPYYACFLLTRGPPSPPASGSYYRQYKRWLWLPGLKSETNMTVLSTKILCNIHQGVILMVTDLLESILEDFDQSANVWQVVSWFHNQICPSFRIVSLKNMKNDKSVIASEQDFSKPPVSCYNTSIYLLKAPFHTEFSSLVVTWCSNRLFVNCSQWEASWFKGEKGCFRR